MSMKEELKAEIRQMKKIGGGRLHTHHFQELFCIAKRLGAEAPFSAVQEALKEVQDEALFSRAAAWDEKLRSIPLLRDTK